MMFSINIVHLFSQLWLATHYVPGIVLDTGNAPVDKADSALFSWSLQFGSG